MKCIASDVLMTNQGIQSLLYQQCSLQSHHYEILLNLDLLTHPMFLPVLDVLYYFCPGKNEDKLSDTIYEKNL